MDALQETASLLSLATELLLLVINNLDTPKDLRNLSSTCSRLHEVTEPIIWRTLEVLNGKRAKQVLTALRRRPERDAYIQDLRLCYETKQEDGIELLDPILPSLVNLRHLTIETPCPLPNEQVKDGAWSPSRINYEKLFVDSVNMELPARPFTILQSVTLHGHSSKNNPFHLGCGNAIFVHPTLRDLTLTDANIDFEPSDIPPQRFNSTPLHSLTFFECNVYIAALDVVLRFPKSLRQLSINEVRYRDHNTGGLPFRMQPTTGHPDFVSVLRRVAPTLEKLVHNCGRLPLAWSSVNNVEADTTGADLESSPSITFPVLTHLEASANSILLHRILEFPELSVWRITDSDSLYGADNAGYLLGHSLRINSRLMARARTIVLKNMDFSQPLTLDLVYFFGSKPVLRARQWWHAKDSPWAQTLRRQVYELATVIKAHGSRFRIFGETFGNMRTEFLPPFLYSEPKPQEKCLYDSDRLWDFAGENFQTLDQEGLPPNLRSTCSACAVAGILCRNNGYGTQCWGCTSSDMSCGYPDRPYIPEDQ